MTSLKWHSGPPPHEGWWNVSIDNTEDVWRWWCPVNGWSLCAFSYDSPEDAAYFAAKFVPEWWKFGIQWTDYWPENARVPRVKP